jgi:hypothetical protein
VVGGEVVLVFLELLHYLPVRILLPLYSHHIHLLAILSYLVEPPLAVLIRLLLRECVFLDLLAVVLEFSFL